MQGKVNIFFDHFAKSLVYPSNKFRRRFRIHNELFIRIHKTIVAHETYLVQERDTDAIENDCRNTKRKHALEKGGGIYRGGEAGLLEEQGVVLVGRDW